MFQQQNDYVEQQLSSLKDRKTSCYEMIPPDNKLVVTRNQNMKGNYYGSGGLQNNPLYSQITLKESTPLKNKT